ncbi:VOC family protein [Aquirhabdus sp.]|uniref:VOC family protein n=1 Tax=Aquirhabdus sp. TaxID=2824160 RepID=UPI00396CACDE
MLQLLTPQPARHPAPTVHAQSLAFLIFERPDLAEAEKFLMDFGLHVAFRSEDELYFRSAGSDPYCYRIVRGEQARFVGFGLSVAERSDLEKLTSLAGASDIEDIQGLGGGAFVQLRDPSGFTVQAVWGRAAVTPLPHRAALALNQGDTHPRINVTQRPAIDPPEVLRVGHVVLEVADFQATCAWYTEHFGFIPSDVQVLPDGSPAVAFLRLNLGDTPADHHTLALAQGFMPCYSHSAFEVIDTDAVGMGQRILRERGWTHAWGIGRHILGSQIFDYWQDPWGDKHEHYCDGDLFSADIPTGIHEVNRAAMAQWGQPMPASFTKPKISTANVVGMVHSLRHSPDLSIRKLITLAKLFG